MKKKLKKLQVKMGVVRRKGRCSGVMDVPIILQEGVGIQVYRTVKMLTSLVVQWLRLPCFHCRGHRFDT